MYKLTLICDLTGRNWGEGEGGVGCKIHCIPLRYLILGKVLWETDLAHSVVPGECVVKMGRVRAELKMKKKEPVKWKDYEVRLYFLQHL